MRPISVQMLVYSQGVGGKQHTQSRKAGLGIYSGEELYQWNLETRHRAQRCSLTVD